MEDKIKTCLSYFEFFFFFFFSLKKMVLLRDPHRNVSRVIKPEKLLFSSMYKV